MCEEIQSENKFELLTVHFSFEQGRKATQTPGCDRTQDSGCILYQVVAFVSKEHEVVHWLFPKKFS